MSFLTRFLPNLLTNIPRVGTELVAQPGGLFTQSIRTVIRCHFPRPSERKRIKRHGWKERMRTAAGRRIIMQRMLKGRFVYTH